MGAAQQIKEKAPLLPPVCRPGAEALRGGTTGPRPPRPQTQV